MWYLASLVQPRSNDRCGSRRRARPGSVDPGGWDAATGRWLSSAGIVAAVLLPGADPAWSQETGEVASGGGLTDVPGIRVGHHTLAERPTGCTVVLAPEGTVGGVDVRGGAPGTRETDVLDPVNTVETVNAVVLAGGSAFGLDAASGVVRYLEEQGVGYPVGPVMRVPIVSAAILFDLGVGGDWTVRPGPGCGYQAATGATAGPVASGSVGAGAGATVGKLAGMGRAMKGGVGSASITLPNGLVVAALVAVNAVGDVIDPATGRVVAGVRTEDGTTLADARVLLRGGGQPGGAAGRNTTIGVVATNARLTKAEATRVAQMAQDGYARAIYPVHTPGDGDTAFSLATGTLAESARATAGQVGALAADVTAAAILDAVRSATSLPTLPAATDLHPPPPGPRDPIEHPSVPARQPPARPSRPIRASHRPDPHRPRPHRRDRPAPPPSPDPQPRDRPAPPTARPPRPIRASQRPGPATPAQPPRPIRTSQRPGPATPARPSRPIRASHRPDPHRPRPH